LKPLQGTSRRHIHPVAGRAHCSMRLRSPTSLQPTQLQTTRHSGHRAPHPTCCCCRWRSCCDGLTGRRHQEHGASKVPPVVLTRHTEWLELDAMNMPLICSTLPLEAHAAGSCEKLPDYRDSLFSP
jgi:hypothetical protein